jgi:hypothetical protein
MNETESEVARVREGREGREREKRSGVPGGAPATATCSSHGNGRTLREVLLVGPERALTWLSEYRS